MWIAIIAAIALGIGAFATAVYQATQKAPQETQEGSFTAPRSSYGDALPIIVGTMQVDSPIMIAAHKFFGSRVFNNGPVSSFNDNPEDERMAGEPTYTAQQKATTYYAGSIDMVLSQRIRDAAGNTVSTVRLRKIWLDDGLIWNGERFANPLTSSMSLLDADPNVNGPGPGGSVKYPGGWIGPGNPGSSVWWTGGVQPIPDGQLVPDLIGAAQYVWDDAWNGSRWVKGQGLERIRFYSGAYSETVDPFFYTFNPMGAGSYPAYNHLVRLVFADFFFGMSGSVPKITAEITQSCPAPEIGDSIGLTPDGLNVNPVSFLYQVLTNPLFGASNKVPPVNVASFSAARATVGSEGIGLSYRLVRPIKLESLVDQIMSHIDGVLYQEPSTGEIHIALNREAVSIATFTEADLLEGPDLEKTSWDSTVSQMRITFSQRGLAANGMTASQIAVAKDPGLTDDNGAADTFDEQSDTIFSAGVASIIAARKLAAANSPLIKMTIAIKRTAVALALRPLDVFTLSYKGLFSNAVMRIAQIDLGTIEDGATRITAIQDRYVPPPIIAPPQPPANVPTTIPRPNVSITKYRISTAPYPIARIGYGPEARNVLTSAYNGGTYLAERGFNYDRFMILAKRPYPSANSFDFKIVDAFGENPTQTGRGSYTPCGTLGDDIVNWSLFTDGVMSTPFDIIGVESYALDRLVSGSVQTNGRNIILIDEEFILIESFTRTSSTSIQVTQYHRMIWDSQCDSGAGATGNWMPGHTAGADVWFFDLRFENEFTLSEPIPSNDFQADNFQASTTDPFAQFYGTGFGSGRYDFTITNVDPSKTNLDLLVPSRFIQDRANLFLPIRRLYANTIVGSSLSAAPAATTLDVQLVASSGNVGSANPREPIRVIPFDSATYIAGSYDSSAPPIDSDLSQWLGGRDNIRIRYRIPAISSTLVTAALSPSANNHRLTIPAEATTRTLQMFVYMMATDSDRSSALQMSRPRAFNFTLTRP